MPRGPLQAKGLLLASIQDANPVIFLEPKVLYRSSVEYVPTSSYTLPLSKCEIVKQGTDITLIGYGSQLYVLEAAAERALVDLGISCEIIDLRTLLPYDIDTIEAVIFIQISQAY